MIPDKWKKVTLGDLGSWRGGGTPSKANESFWRGSIPWVSPKDMKASVITSTQDYINELAISNSSTNLISKGAILLVTRSGILQHTLPISIAGRDVAINQDIKALTPNESILSEFAFQLLRAKEQELLKECSKVGTTVESIDFEALKDFEVFLPPLSEQNKIAEILSCWDRELSAINSLLSLKKSTRRSLINFLTLNPKQLASNEARSLAIGEICVEVSERNKAARTHEVLSCSKYEGFVRSLDYFGKQIFSRDLSGYKIIRRGMFGYPSNHIEEGSIGLQTLFDVALVSPIYTVFKCDERIVDSSFLFAVLKTDWYRQLFQSSTKASVDRRGSLRWKTFSSLPIILPTLEYQKKVARLIFSMDYELKLLTQRRKLIETQKQGLMQQLLTGRIRVKV